MADKALKSIKFPGLTDTYTIAAEEAAEITNLKSATDEIDNRFVISSSTKNILDIGKISEGYLSSNGSLVVLNDWVSSPLIDVSNYTTVYFSGENISSGNRARAPMYFLSKYDSSGTFLSQSSADANTYTVESGVAFIRFSWHSEIITDVMLRDDDLYTEYVAYAKSITLADCPYVTEDEVTEQVIDEVDDVIATFADPAWTPYSTTITENKMLLSNGNLHDYTGVHCVTGYIDVSGAESVKITGSSNYQNGIAAFYTAAKTFISLALGAASGADFTTYKNELVSVPANAKYVVAAGTTDVPPVVSREYGYAVNTYKPWNNIKWLCFGESITDDRNTKATKRYMDYVAEATGIQTINAGSSGSGYSKNGDYGTGTNWHERILDYDNTQFDVITFFGSFNDLGSMTLGTATDTGTSTIGGCINTTLDNLFSFKPLAVVGVVTPTPWEQAKPGNTNADNYVNLLKEICNKRSIPCLDLYHESLLRPWDSTFRTLAYSRDNGSGTHPDENGHALIAPRFKGFLETLLL